MTSSPSAPVFSRWVSWLGILILGAGVASATPTSSVAAAPALATSSLEFSALSSSLGTLSGAAPVAFDSGIRGWGVAPLSTLGPLGLEWDDAGSIGRRAYQGSTESENFSPGGASSWVGAGSVARSPRETIFVRQTVRVEGNTMRFTMALEPIDGNVLESRRLYFSTSLAGGFASDFRGAGTSTLVVTDTSHTHPTLVLHASSGQGVVTWGGAESFTDPLSNGDLTPTLYVHSTASDEFTLSVTVGVVDRDPCSADNAVAFAQSKAGSLGEAWPAQTSCLQAPTWNLVADGEPTVATVDTGLPLGGLPEETSVALEFSGLPEGVTISRGTDSGTQAGFSLSAEASVTPGIYTPTITRTRREILGGVTTISQPDTVTGSVTISAAPVPPPPPAPEEVEEEPVAEPEATAPVREPASPRNSSQAPAPVVPEVVADVAPKVPPARVAEETADPEPVAAEVPPAVDPEPEYTWPDPRDVRVAEPQIPEPVNAGAWLGVSLAAVALGGGWLGFWRRRKARRD